MTICLLKDHLTNRQKLWRRNVDYKDKTLLLAKNQLINKDFIDKRKKEVLLKILELGLKDMHCLRERFKHGLYE